MAHMLIHVFFFSLSFSLLLGSYNVEMALESLVEEPGFKSLSRMSGSLKTLHVALVEAVF